MTLGSVSNHKTSDRLATPISPSAVYDRSQQLALGLFFLALTASPAYVIRFKVGPLPSTLLEVLVVAATVAGLVALRGRLPWRNPYLWPGLVLLAGAAVDTVVAPDLRAAAGILKAYFVEPALAALVIAGLVRTRDHVRLLLLGLALAGVAVALINLDKQLTDLAHHTFNFETPPVAIFLTANAIALYLIPLEAIAFAFLLYGDDRRERLAAGAFLVLTLPAVLLSYSRAGWLAVGAVIVFVGFFHPWRWRLAGALAAVSTVVVAFVPSIRRRVLVEFDPRDPHNTFQLRLALWKSTLNMLSHRPLFGGGLSGFRTSLVPYQDRLYHEDVIYPHNIFLNFWTETGLLGLAGFLWLAWQALSTARRGLAGAPWIRVLSIGLLAMLLTIFVHGLADAPYFKNDLSLAFWAVLGIHLGATRGLSSPD